MEMQTYFGYISSKCKHILDTLALSFLVFHFPFPLTAFVDPGVLSTTGVSTTWPADQMQPRDIFHIARCFCFRLRCIWPLNALITLLCRSDGIFSLPEMFPVVF